MPEESIIRIIVEGNGSSSEPGQMTRSKGFVESGLAVSGGILTAAGYIAEITKKSTLEKITTISTGAGLHMLPLKPVITGRTYNSRVFDQLDAFIDYDPGLMPDVIGGRMADGSMVNPKWATIHTPPNRSRIIAQNMMPTTTAIGTMIRKSADLKNPKVRNLRMLERGSISSDFFNPMAYARGIGDIGNRAGSFLDAAAAKFGQRLDDLATKAVYGSGRVLSTIIGGTYNTAMNLGHGFITSIAPHTMTSTVGSLVKEGHKVSQSAKGLYRAVSTPTVGTGMRLLRGGGLAGGGLALALGISSYIDGARRDAVMTATIEGRDVTGGEIIRSVHDKVASTIDGIGSFFQKSIAGVSTFLGSVPSNLIVGLAAYTKDSGVAEDANRYTERVNTFYHHAVGLKTTKDKIHSLGNKFEQSRVRALDDANSAIEKKIEQNAQSFAEDYIHTGLGSRNELQTLYESQMTKIIRDKFRQQFMEEWDKTHNKTTFIRAQLASQGD